MANLLFGDNKSSAKDNELDHPKMVELVATIAVTRKHVLKFFGEEGDRENRKNTT